MATTSTRTLILDENTILRIIVSLDYEIDASKRYGKIAENNINELEEVKQIIIFQSNRELALKEMLDI